MSLFPVADAPGGPSPQTSSPLFAWICTFFPDVPGAHGTLSLEDSFGRLTLTAVPGGVSVQDTRPGQDASPRLARTRPGLTDLLTPRPGLNAQGRLSGQIHTALGPLDFLLRQQVRKKGEPAHLQLNVTAAGPLTLNGVPYTRALAWVGEQPGNSTPEVQHVLVDRLPAAAARSFQRQGTRHAETLISHLATSLWPALCGGTAPGQAALAQRTAQDAEEALNARRTRRRTLDQAREREADLERQFSAALEQEHAPARSAEPVDRGEWDPDAWSLDQAAQEAEETAEAETHPPSERAEALFEAARTWLVPAGHLAGESGRNELHVQDSFGHLTLRLARHGVLLEDHRAGQDPAPRSLPTVTAFKAALDPRTPINAAGLTEGTLITRLGETRFSTGVDTERHFNAQVQDEQVVRLTLSVHPNDPRGPVRLWGHGYTLLQVTTPASSVSTGLVSLREDGVFSVYYDCGAARLLADLGHTLRPRVLTRAAELNALLQDARQSTRQCQKAYDACQEEG